MEAGPSANTIGEQFATVVHTPAPFFAVVIPAIFTIWWLVQREHKTRLANAISTSEMHKARADDLAVQMAAAQSNAAHSRALTVAEPEPQALPSLVPTKPNLADLSKVHALSHVTPEYMLGMFEGRTDLAAAQMIGDVIGMWTHAEGEVMQVTPYPGEIMVSLLKDMLKFVFCYFPVESNRAAKLDIGEIVRLEGQIEQFDRKSVTLVQCEFTD